MRRLLRPLRLPQALDRLARHRRGAAAIVAAVDWYDRLRGRERMVPPWRLGGYVGPGDFTAVGELFRGYLVDVGGLEPGDRVLDVGCGIGRIAVPLLDYLTGSYEGFDVAPVGIAWCRRKITRGHPRFRFRLADVRHPMYNPTGARTAAAYRFPYADEDFDFAFATSVFTHLLPAEARNYAAEVARVLRPGGRVLATFFLTDVDPTPEAGFDFHVVGDGYRAVDAACPEAAVGYPLADVERMLADAGLAVDAVHRGHWSGREGLADQDIVVASRRPGD